MLLCLGQLDLADLYSDCTYWNKNAAAIRPHESVVRQCVYRYTESEIFGIPIARIENFI